MRTERAAEVPNGAEIPDKGVTHLGRLHLNVLALEHIYKHVPTVGLAVVVGLITFLVQGYRLSAAPDVYGDEAVHIQIAHNLARGVGLVGVGRPVFFANPPAYFLVEAMYIKLTGLTNADLFTALFSVRYLNTFLSALTAVLLMLFGRKLHSYKAGLVAAVLFLLDPYVQSINRRNMLETLAMLCALFGMYIFFTHRSHLTPRQRIGAGIAFGLAMLTKEAMALDLLALIVYAWFFKRSQLRDVIWVIVTACIVYLPYPGLALATDQGRNYLMAKLSQVSRIPLAIEELFPGGSHPPNSSAYAHSPQNILSLLPQYGTSYLLIALAAMFTAVLIFRFKHLATARYLIAWNVVSFGGMWPVALVSQWYFYYLIVPCIVVSGYTVGLLFDRVLYPRSHEQISNKAWRWPTLFTRTSLIARTWAAIIAILLVMLLYNGYIWTANYARGNDDAYIHAIEYVRLHIPKGETVVVDNADIRGVFMPDYDPCCSNLDSQAINAVVEKNVRYFVLSSKSQWYPGNSPQFYTWVVRNSHPVFEQEGRTYGMVGVYVRTATGSNSKGQLYGLGTPPEN